MIARRFCAECPVHLECLEQVDPKKSRFDGTAAGRFWINGRDVTGRASTGFWNGEYHHSHVSHVRVRQVLLAQAPLADLSPSELMIFAFAAAEHGADRRKICRWLGISALTLHAVLATVERCAPADTVSRAARWPMKSDYMNLSRRPWQVRHRETSAKRLAATPGS
jgi:hypothetical protein